MIGVGGVFYPGLVWTAAACWSATGELFEPSYAKTGFPVPETTPLEDSGRFAERAVESERLLMEWHHAGDYRATMLRYPQVYGPRQLAPQEWSIHCGEDPRPAGSNFWCPTVGCCSSRSSAGANAAQTVLAAVDEPAASAGQTFNCGDAEPLTQRDWICILAEALGGEVELVSVPFELAEPTFANPRGAWKICLRVLDISKARQLLRYAPCRRRAPSPRRPRW